jgi:integrase/recombinase XerD
LPTVLTPAEVERLFAALGSSALRAVLILAYGAGLRVREACRLRLQDVDSRAGVLHVRNTKRNRDRDVMLSPKLLASSGPTGAKRRPPGPELFPGRAGAGTTLTRAAISRALKKALAQAGLSGPPNRARERHIARGAQRRTRPAFREPDSPSIES